MSTQSDVFVSHQNDHSNCCLFIRKGAMKNAKIQDAVSVLKWSAFSRFSISINQIGLLYCVLLLLLHRAMCIPIEKIGEMLCLVISLS